MTSVHDKNDIIQLVEESCQHHNGLKLTEKTDSHAGRWWMVGSPRSPRVAGVSAPDRAAAPQRAANIAAKGTGDGRRTQKYLGSSRPLLASQKLIRIGSTKCQDIGMMIQDAAVIINPQIHSLSSSAHGIHAVLMNTKPSVPPIILLPFSKGVAAPTLRAVAGGCSNSKCWQ